MSKTILALDIGSTKVAAAIAQQKDDELTIIGTGISKAQGVRKGVITHIDRAAKAIKKAYEDAKRIAGVSPKKAIVALSGAYIQSTNSSGIVNIPNKEISIDELNRVMQTALYNANIPHEYEVVHVLPYKFKVDNQDTIDDPLGMNASRLEVDTHIITAPKSSLFNLTKAVKQAGIEIENIVLSGYASALAVLNEDEKELGACIIDMGGSTCNLVIYNGKSIVYNDFLAVGSMHITNDLSMALHTPLSIAEEIKIYYGDLTEPKSDYIEIPIIGDEENSHQVSLEIVYNVIYARVEETLMILAKSIEQSKLRESLGAGVILTGGMTKLEGLRELASAIFDHMPVRIAKPKNLSSLHASLEDPSYSTLIGLIHYGSGAFTPYEIDSNQRLRYKNEQAFSDSGKDKIDILTPLPPPTKEEEIMKELGNIESFKEPASSTRDSVSKFLRWLRELF